MQKLVQIGYALVFFPRVVKLLNSTEHNPSYFDLLVVLVVLNCVL